MKYFYIMHIKYIYICYIPISMDSYNIWYHFYESQTTDQLIKMILGWIIIQNVAEIWIVSCVILFEY